MEIKIEKDIPVPTAQKKGRRRTYPLDSMSVGDSFVADVRDRGSVGSSICQYGKSSGKKFKTSREGDNVRVWRIE